MGLFIQELKKTLIYSKSIFAIVGIILLYMIFQLTIGKNLVLVNNEIEYNKEQYHKIIEKLGGKLTDESKEYIEKLQNEKKENGKIYNELEEKLFENKITEEEYNDWVSKNEDELKRDNVLNIVEKKYSYVLDNPDRRYFIDDNGWKFFFKNNISSILLSVIIIFFVSFFYCKDYEENMICLNKICKNGGFKLAFTRYLVCIFLGLIVSIMTLFCDLAVCDMEYGLYNSDYPLQSIEMFECIPWNISILEAVIVLFVFRLVVIVGIVSIVILVARITKNGIYAVPISFFVIYFPMIFLDKYDIYTNPYLVGFIIPRGYFEGVYSEKSIDSQLIYSSLMQLMKKGIVIISISGILSLLSIYIYFNRRKINFYKIKNRIKGVFFIICICLTFSSCDEKKDINNDFFINEKLECSFFSYKDIIVDAAKEPYSVIEDGEKMDLFRDVFIEQQDYDNITIQYMDEKYVYYIKYMESIYECRKISLESFEDTLIYSENNDKICKINYLGINDEENIISNSNTTSDKISHFFIIKGDLYIVSEKNNNTNICIEKINLFTNSSKMLISNMGSSEISIYNEKLYYLDKTKNLKCFDFDNEKMIDMKIDAVKKFLLYNNKLIVNKLNDDCFEYDLNNDEIGNVYKGIRNLLRITKDGIYYTDINYNIYNIKNDKIKLLAKEKMYVYDIIKINGKLKISFINDAGKIEVKDLE